MSDKKIAKIDDPRIAGYTQRMRNGRMQVFYTGDDCRDFERYRAEGGGRNPNVEMHDKPDTINIEPPERHYYAELIDGEWWWVSGCAECNGMPRNSWKSYIECDKHDVCRTCGCSREELADIPWGGKNGWQCKPCADREHEEKKQAALAAMPEYDEWDFRSLYEVKCPYCNLEIDTGGDPDFYQEGDPLEHECPRCDNKFTVEVCISVSYTMKRLENKDDT